MNTKPVIDSYFSLFDDCYRFSQVMRDEVAALRLGNLNILTREYGAWAESTFKDSTPASIIIHLTREVIELAQNPVSGAEMADILLLIFHLAYKQGVDLTAAVRTKFVINQGRAWKSPDDSGVVEHIAIDRHSHEGGNPDSSIDNRQSTIGNQP